MIGARTLTLTLCTLGALGYLHRPAYFNGKLHRLLPPPASSSAEAFGAKFNDDVEERLLPYAQIVHPAQFDRVPAFSLFNVSFVYLARPGIRRVFGRLHWGDSTQHTQMPWREFDVPYDEQTGRPKPLLAALPIQATPSVLSITLIFHEVGALSGRDVAVGSQFTAVDSFFMNTPQPFQVRDYVRACVHVLWYVVHRISGARVFGPAVAE
jgi:hypothetical protein